MALLTKYGVSSSLATISPSTTTTQLQPVSQPISSVNTVNTLSPTVAQTQIQPTSNPLTTVDYSNLVQLSPIPGDAQNMPMLIPLDPMGDQNLIVLTTPDGRKVAVPANRSGTLARTQSWVSDPNLRWGKQSSTPAPTNRVKQSLSGPEVATGQTSMKNLLLVAAVAFLGYKFLVK